MQEAAENAARLDPNHGGGHAAMGMYLYYCLQDYDGAWSELEQARRQAPNDPLIIQALGLVKRRQGELHESIELQMQAARLDPLNEDIWVNIAWSYRGMRRFNDAIAMFDRAHAIAPNDRSLVLRRVETEVAAGGDLAQAARTYEKVHPAFGTRGYGGFIAVLVFQRRFDEAIAKLTADMEQTDAGKVSPLDTARAHLTVAELNIAAGRAAEARPLLLQAESEIAAMKAQGNNGPDLRAQMIAVHAWLGRREDAERELAEHISQQAKDRWTGPLAEEDAARAYLIMGEHDRALSLLERLVSQAYADAITPALLRLDPLYDRVRDNPRFRKLAGEKPLARGVSK